MNRTYSTKNLEIGSTIKAVTGIDPELTFNSQGLATLVFPVCHAVADVVMSFDSGIQVDARTLLSVRNQMYKRVRAGAKP